MKAYGVDVTEYDDDYGKVVDVIINRYEQQGPHADFTERGLHSVRFVEYYETETEADEAEAAWRAEYKL